MEASCAAEITTTPSCGAGRRKRPRSSRLVWSAKPRPSWPRILDRSPRRRRKTHSSAACGSPRRCSWTCSARRSRPRRMSVTPAASRTRVDVGAHHHHHAAAAPGTISSRPNSATSRRETCPVNLSAGHERRLLLRAHPHETALAGGLRLMRRPRRPDRGSHDPRMRVPRAVNRSRVTW
jgi:hypothetical protein